MPVGLERVVDVLDVRGVHPHSRADARLGDRVQVGAGHEVADGERDRLGREHDGVRRAGGVTDQAEVALVEGLRGREVAHLQGDEVGSGHGHVRVHLSTHVSEVCQLSDIDSVSEY